MNTNHLLLSFVLLCAKVFLKAMGTCTLIYGSVFFPPFQDAAIISYFHHLFFIILASNLLGEEKQEN